MLGMPLKIGAYDARMVTILYRFTKNDIRVMVTSNQQASETQNGRMRNVMHWNAVGLCAPNKCLHISRPLPTAAALVTPSRYVTSRMRLHTALAAKLYAQVDGDCRPIIFYRFAVFVFEWFYDWCVKQPSLLLPAKAFQHVVVK